MGRLKAEAGNLKKAIAATPDFSKFKDKIQVTVTQEGLRIDLVEASEGLFFDIGKAHLKPETVKLIKLIAAAPRRPRKRHDPRRIHGRQAVRHPETIRTGT